MKSKKMLASILAVSMFATVGLTGCGSDEPKKSTEDSKAAEESKGPDAEQYLNVILTSEPKSIDQSITSDGNASEILNQNQEGLTRLVADENGKAKIEPGIAKEWTKSEDGLTYTFKLRDAKWADGQPIVAGDFEYAIKRTLDPKTGSQVSDLLKPILNAEECLKGATPIDDLGVKALDDKTFEVKLKAPCPYFMDITYYKVMQPQRKDFVEKYGDSYGTEAETMISSGPFKLESWVHNSKLEFVKNENYWDADNVKLDKLTMKIIAETNSIMQELDAGTLDLAGVNKPEWIQKFDASGNYNVIKGFRGSTTYEFYNQSPKIDGEVNILSNAKVRQAFLLATDREKKIEVLRKGIGEPATGVVPPLVNIGDSEYRDLVKDEPIKKLQEKYKDKTPKDVLIEGLKELNLDPDPSKYTINYLETDTGTTGKEWAEYQQQEMEEKLGVKIDVEYVEWAIATDRTKSGDYQICGQMWTGDYNDPNTFLDYWKTGSPVVCTFWSNKEFDKLIDDASVESDQNKRAELFSKAENILLCEDAVCNPDCYAVRNTYVKKFVKNYNYPLFGSPNYKTVYTEGRK